MNETRLVDKRNRANQRKPTNNGAKQTSKTPTCKVGAKMGGEHYCD